MISPDKKPPTIQDIAESLGMHNSTVSLALSGNSADLLSDERVKHLYLGGQA